MSNTYGKPKTPSYAADGPLENPYLEGQREWDERMGTHIVYAENWRRFAFGCLGALILTLVGFVYYANKATVIPYIVEVGPEGEVKLVGQVTSQEWSIDMSAKQLVLTEFLKSIRELSLDENVYLERIEFTQGHTTSAGKLLLNEYYEQAQRNALFGKERRVITIKLITPFKNSVDNFRVEWKEERYTKDNQLLDTTSYAAEIHTLTRRPETKDEVTINPLGVYVDFFRIQEIR